MNLFFRKKDKDNIDDDEFNTEEIDDDVDSSDKDIEADETEKKKNIIKNAEIGVGIGTVAAGTAYAIHKSKSNNENVEYFDDKNDSIFEEIPNSNQKSSTTETNENIESQQPSETNEISEESTNDVETPEPSAKQESTNNVETPEPSAKQEPTNNVETPEQSAKQEPTNNVETPEPPAKQESDTDNDNKESTPKKKNGISGDTSNNKIPKPSLSTLNVSTLTVGTLAADTYAIYTAMRDINESANGYDNTILNNRNNSYTSSTKIPTSLYGAQSEVINASSVLVGKLSEEATLISGIADTIYQMDQDLTQKSNDLSYQSDILQSSSITSQLDSLVNNYYDDSISFTTGLFSSTNTEGRVGKVCMSDIDSILSGNTLTGPIGSNFEAEIDNAKKINEKLSDFTTILSNGKFSGKIWNSVKNKINDYSDLMNERITANEKLKEAYIKSLTLIKDYMGEDEELDDSQLPDLKLQIEQLQKDIDDAEAKINEKIKITKIDEYDNLTVTYENLYSGEEIEKFRKFIAIAEETKKELEKKVEKLEGLPAIMNQAEQIVNDALAEMQTGYGNRVSQITTGKPSNYIPYNSETNQYINQNTRISSGKTLYPGTIILKKNKDFSQIEWGKDVTAYIKENGYPTWGNGFGSSGCGMSTLSEVVSNLVGRDVTPTELISTEVSLSNGKRTKTCNGTQLFEVIAGEYGIRSEKISTNEFSEAYVQNVLKNGGQIEHTVRDGAHYMAIVGYNESNGKYIIFDPWTRFAPSVYREYTWNEYVKYREGGIGSQAHALYLDN